MSIDDKSGLVEADAEASMEAFVACLPEWDHFKQDQLVASGPPLTPVEQNAIDEARKLARASRAPSTLRAYESDWRIFIEWCDRIGHQWLPASPRTVALFLASQGAHGRVPWRKEAENAMEAEFLALALEEKRDSLSKSKIAKIEKQIKDKTPDLRLSPSVLNRRLAAIAINHRMAKLHPPTEDFDVKVVMAGIRRSWGKKTDKKAAATNDILKQMIDSIPTETLIGKRDRAILLLGFAGAFRRSELVSIDIEHIYKDEDGFIVTVHNDKTNKENPDGTPVPVPAEPGSSYCPVSAIEDWLQAAGFESGPVFCRMYRGDSMGKTITRLTDQSVANIVKRYALRINQDPKLFSGHSLRRGFVTSAARTENPNAIDIAKQTRHKSLAMVLSYVEEQKLLRDAPGAGLLSNGDDDTG